MKKRTCVAGLVCSILILMTACENSEPKNDGASSSAASAESITYQQSVNEMISSAEESLANADFQPPQDENETYQERVIVSFQAVEGAVIYDTEYDENGFPVSCQFHKKCESCGYVSNSSGQARGNLTTSFHCDECGNDQQVEIVANFDFVEVTDR